MRVLLVVNRRSRAGRRTGERAALELQARGVEIVRFLPQRKLRTPPCDAIVAVGGDGTLLPLIGRAMREAVPIGIVPAGTFNDLARTLGIPFDVPAACEVIVAGHWRAIDVGCVNGRYFMTEASVGISSRVARLQTTELKRRFGMWAVVTTALQALRFARPMFAEVTHDSTVTTFKTVQLTVANSHRFGGVITVTDAAIDDGWLDLYSVNIETFAQAFQVGRAILQGRRETIPGLCTLRAKRFVLRQHRPHHITADGEPVGNTPATFDVLPKALRVLVPE